MRSLGSRIDSMTECCSAGMAAAKVWVAPLIAMVAERSGPDLAHVFGLAGWAGR